MCILLLDLALLLKIKALFLDKSSPTILDNEGKDCGPPVAAWVSYMTRRVTILGSATGLLLP